MANAKIDFLVRDLFEEINRYRCEMPEIPSNERLFQIYASGNRFDNKETIFVKRILQTVLPENIRSKIATNLFEKYVGIPENVFARELYLSTDQIRCMKKEGMHIGIHGYDHYWLGNLNKEKMIKDVDMALEVMNGFIDLNNWTMNYPYGSYNDDVIEYISGKGCKLAMTTAVRVASNTDNRFLLPRLDCNDFPPKSNEYKRY